MPKDITVYGFAADGHVYTIVRQDASQGGMHICYKDGVTVGARRKCEDAEVHLLGVALDSLKDKKEHLRFWLDQLRGEEASLKEQYKAAMAKVRKAAKARGEE